MKFIKTIGEIKLLSESVSTEIDIYDVAWLYFLHNIYDGKIEIDSWENDKRMNKDRTCDVSLSKFYCVKKEDGYYISDPSCVKIINKYFGYKNFEDCLKKRISLKKYDSKSYRISQIPYELYMENNPNVENAFERISDRIMDHFNSQRCNDRIIQQLSKTRHIKKFNLSQFYRYFPDLPKKIKVYRGVKGKYDPNGNEKGYSCWTHEKEQAERFAKYIFTGRMQFNPVYSKDPHVLEAEVEYKDIAVFIGGDENEVILKNPVDIISVNPVSI